MATIGWPPGPHSDASSPEAVPCARCGHRADSHLHPSSCSGRVPWGRRCRCTGYTRAESADYTPGAAPRAG